MSRVIPLTFRFNVPWTEFIATQPTHQWARDDVLVVQKSLDYYAALWDPSTDFERLPKFGTKLRIPLHVASRYKSATAHFASALANNQVANTIAFFLPTTDPGLARYVPNVDSRCYMYEIEFGGAPRVLTFVRAYLNGERTDHCVYTYDYNGISTTSIQYGFIGLQNSINNAFDAAATIVVCASRETLTARFELETGCLWKLHHWVALSDRRTLTRSSSTGVATCFIDSSARALACVRLIKERFRCRCVKIIWDRYATVDLTSMEMSFTWCARALLRNAHQCLAIAEVALAAYGTIGPQDLLEVFLKLPEMYARTRAWLSERVEYAYRSIRRVISARMAPARCTRSKQKNKDEPCV